MPDVWDPGNAEVDRMAERELGMAMRQRRMQIRIYYGDDDGADSDEQQCIDDVQKSLVRGKRDVEGRDTVGGCWIACPRGALYRQEDRPRITFTAPGSSLSRRGIVRVPAKRSGSVRNCHLGTDQPVYDTAERGNGARSCGYAQHAETKVPPSGLISGPRRQ